MKRDSSRESSAHIFALFLGASNVVVDKQAQKIVVHDPELINRIVTVLRLKTGRTIVLFDTHYSYTCELTEITKKILQCTMVIHQEVIQQLPKIDLLLPVLERDALEDTVYMATVYGVNSIQLVATEKSRRALTEKDYLRLQKISVAAAEQSKQFLLPTIKPVITLENFLDNHMARYTNSVAWWSDISGKKVLQELAQKKSENSHLVTLGPEGDYTPEEKELLKKQFTPVKLTNTILRAKDAATLLLGIFRVNY